MTVRTPGMTPQKAPDGQPVSFENTVDLDGFPGILGTGRRVPAGMRQPGRNPFLIEPYQKHERQA